MSGHDVTRAWTDNHRLTSLIMLAGSTVGAGGAVGCDSGVHREAGSSPLGEQVAVPWITTPLPVEADDVRVVLVLLRGSTDPDPPRPPTVVVVKRSIRVVWAGGERSELRLNG